jgi:hypothetical protein
MKLVNPFAYSFQQLLGLIFLRFIEKYLNIRFTGYNCKSGVRAILKETLDGSSHTYLFQFLSLQKIDKQEDYKTQKEKYKIGYKTRQRYLTSANQ